MGYSRGASLEAKRQRKASIAELLHRLLDSDAKWVWLDSHTEVFNKLKNLISSDSVLVPFDETLPILLTCDASPYGVGAVLSHQLPDGREAPIAFFSRTLTSTERNYAQIDKEALSIISGVKKFHNFLYGHHFTLITDHQPLLVTVELILCRKPHSAQSSRQRRVKMVVPMKDVFGLVDYLVFGVMLLISAGIGVWYAFADRKKADPQHFLMGGRSLSVFPVAMSVLASFMSAVTLLGTPAEVYRYGTQYFTICIAFFLVVPATAYLYLPVFYNLGVTSAYEYLEMRFHGSVRTIGSIVFTMHMLMYMPVVLYAPALALSEVTGIRIWTAVLSIGLVCTFYTSIGGMKAVVWTDLFQSVMMYASILIIVVKGTYDLGGFDVVWQRSVEGMRIEFFRFDFDPTIRHTFWSLVFGGYITWMGNYAANQAMIQRYLTIGSLRGAQGCLWINLPALVLLILITSMSGLVIFAFFYDCDPIGSKLIDAPDQLFPRFVMETLGAFPGIPGLFVSGIFSGALSTVSSGVNSLAAVALEDFIKKFIAKDISHVWATRVTKSLAVFFGLLSIALVFVAEQMGGVLQAALTIHGIVGGPMLGVFTLGMFFPFANTWGASTGLVSGFVMAMWFGMGAFASHPYHPEAPRSYHNCSDLYFNATGIDIFNITTPVIVPSNEDILPPYRLSYLWLSAVGFVVVLIVGVSVSFLTGGRKGEDIDERLLSPLIIWLRKYMPKRNLKKVIPRKGRRGTSMVTLRTSVVSNSEFYPAKISYITDTKIS
ncbi:hypothetical protein JTE90_020401 [Oedothorax gibbosus]|uniref:Reverse transcriptase/retrotransposon-derived protein RNase H-like domain-containing protein n=1 Tax=Oedothorax gibbosus TaxID=931172 RepID=A0AAV6UF77_9ARAC|nr:hypothetical protein JTE90_020401 [Oedothorax gibbosus]